MREQRGLREQGWDDDVETHAARHDRAGKVPVTARLMPFVARAADGTAVTAEPSVAEAAVERARRGSGAPLPDDVRLKFESCLDVDLCGVRVHTDGESAQAAGAVGAHAFAVGQDIHFAAGQYDPDSLAGERLLAHEVAHTVQQGTSPGRQNKLAVSAPADAAEVEADRAADAMVSGQAFSVGAAAPVLARAADPAAAAPAADANANAAASEPVTLAEAMGARYEGGRDADLATYWEARCEIDPLVASIRARDGGDAERIESEILASEALLDEIAACEDAVVETATRDASGKVIVDKIAVADLEQARAELLDRAELFLAETKLWDLLLGIPILEGLEKLVRGWVAILKGMEARWKIAVASYDRIHAMLVKYQKEFTEACNKVKLDAASVAADIIILTCLTGPYGFVAATMVTLIGVAAGYDIDYGEETQPLTYFNGTLATADMARQAVEWKAASEGAVVSEGFSKGLKGLSIAVDTVSTLNDSAEAAQHKLMIDEITTELRAWQAEYAGLAKAWPATAACLNGAIPCLNSLQQALQKALPAAEAAQRDVTALRARL